MVIIVVLGCASYLVYARRGYYTKEDITLANKQFVINGDDEEEPSTELQKIANKADHDGDMEANIHIVSDDEFHRL